MLLVVTSENRIAAYQGLLLSDWKRSLPSESISLLWESLEFPQDESLWFEVLNPRIPIPEERFRILHHQLVEAGRWIRYEHLPQLPGEYHLPRKPSARASLCLRMTAYLLLRADSDLEGDTGFFLDLQALAFHSAIHFLMPEVKDKYPTEHAILLHAVALFPLEYTTQDPAHYSYLTSLVHEYVGNTSDRLATRCAFDR